LKGKEATVPGEKFHRKRRELSISLEVKKKQKKKELMLEKSPGRNFISCLRKGEKNMFIEIAGKKVFHHLALKKKKAVGQGIADDHKKEGGTRYCG